MRVTTSVVFAILAALPVGNALPYGADDRHVAPRDTAHKPKYSVVPLEPGDSDDGNDDSSEDEHESGPSKGKSDHKDPAKHDGKPGGHKSDSHGEETIISVVETVIRTQGPVTVIRTAEPDTVTHTKTLPTTVVSVVDMEGEVTTVTAEPKTTSTSASTSMSTSTSKSTSHTAQKPRKSTTSCSTTSTTTRRPAHKAPAPTDTSASTPVPTSTRPAQPPPAAKVPPPVVGSPQKDQGEWEPEPTPALDHDASPEEGPTQASGFWTTKVETVTSTSTNYDNGQWHTTYPSWNETEWR